MELKQMLEKRAGLVKQAREILDRHKDKGVLPGDEQAHFDRFWGEQGTESEDTIHGLNGLIEKRNSFIERQQRVEQAAAWDREVQPRNVDPNRPAAAQEIRLHKNVDGVERRAADPKQRALYERFVKGRNGGSKSPDVQAEMEYRDLLADTAGSGHDLLPPVEFIDQILIPRDRQVLIRKWATVRRLLKSTDGYQPTIETNPDDADWTTEITAVTPDSGATTGKRELKPNVLTKEVLVSIKELLVLPQVSELIANRLGYKFGVAEEKAFMVGTGGADPTTPQPLGIFVASNAGIKTSSDSSTSNTATAVTMDGLQKAKFKLAPPYWPNARWIMHPDIMQQVATLKDLLGRYLWQPNTIVGQPDMLLGFPAFLDVWAPNTIEAGAYVAVLGDFSYYHIADLVEPFSVQRLNELHALTNQVGFLGREYCDGMPVMSEAFVRVQLGDGSGS
jgi:HK97 family phage major capsid protein